MNKSGTLDLKSLLYYFILIPFLRPQGFEVYFSVYKKLFVIWLYLSMVFIIIYMVKKLVQGILAIKYCTFAALMYYVIFIFISFFIQRGIAEGLQKIFAAPALILICSIFLQENSVKFIRCMTNILLMLFILNLSIFSPLFFGQFFNYEEHLIFLGHVQVCSQFGILGVFTAVLSKFYNVNINKKNNLLLILSMITMVVSTTLASYVSIILLALGYIYYKKSKKCSLLTWKSQIYLVGFILVNLFVFAFLYANNWRNPFDFIDLNGRDFIWEQCYDFFRASPIIGYGVHGVKIQVFWTLWNPNHPGFNYAHNQIWQLAIDGGIILIVIFVVFMMLYMLEINKIKNRKIKAFTNLIMLIVFLVMCFESTFEYNYILIILCMISYLSELQYQRFDITDEILLNINIKGHQMIN